MVIFYENRLNGNGTFKEIDIVFQILHIMLKLSRLCCGRHLFTRNAFSFSLNILLNFAANTTADVLLVLSLLPTCGCILSIICHV